MTLDGHLIFYWIHKKYPKSLHFFSGNGDKVQKVTRPMFWDLPADMRGHLVVVRPEHWQQIVHHTYEALFLCIGVDPQLLANGPNECIAIPDPVSIEEIFNLVLEIFEKFQLWEQKLQLAVDTLLSYGAIIRSCDDLIAEPMALVDDHFRYVSYSKRKTIEIGWEDKYVSPNSALPLDVINLLTSLPEFKGLETERDVFVHVGAEHLLQKNIYDGERYVGRLSIRYHKNNAVNLYHQQILRIVAIYIEKLYARLGSFWHRQKKNEQERQFLASVLQGSKPPVAQIAHALSHFSFREGTEMVVVLLQSHASTRHDKLNAVLMGHIESLMPGSLCLMVEQQFYVLVNLQEFERRMECSFRQELAYFLRESLLLAGISRKFYTPGDLYAAGRQARIALEVGRQIDSMYWYFNFDDYAFAYLLQQCSQDFEPTHIIAPALLTLLRYDAKNGTELVKTLRVYIACAYNAVDTAKRLNVARSTFLKRLERIEILTKLDLESFSQRAYLMLSYMMLERQNDDSAPK